MSDPNGRHISRRVILTTMARRGMFNPGLPQRNIGQVTALRRWGYGLHGQLRAAAARSPRRIAVIDESHGEISYAELLARSVGVAGALRDRGLGQGDAVGLLARNHVGAVTAIAGAGLLGLDLVLLNTGMAASVVAQVADREGVRLLIHDEELSADVADLASSADTVSESELAADARRTAPGDPVQPPGRPGRTILLTSGTTGTPRGAGRPEPKSPSGLVSVIERIPLRVASRTLLSAPVFHTWGYSALLMGLGLRHTLVLQRRFDAARAHDALATHRCDTMIAVPVMLQRMMELPGPTNPRNLPKLRVVATSGSAFPHGFATRFMDRYGDVLYSLCGSTEASWICIATPRELRRDPDTVGTPPPGTVVRILDNAGREAPEGSTGRIFCANSMMFTGYTSGEPRESVDGLVSTGDVGHISNGLYFVDGRADGMIVSGGENVYPADVERVLGAHPAVREVAVTGIPDEDFGQRLAAAVVLLPGNRLTAAEVQRYVRGQLARYAVPRAVVFVDEIPRNAMGKVPVEALNALMTRE